MSQGLQNALVTAGLAALALLVIWVFGSLTAVKIIVILVIWFAILGAVGLGLEMATQRVARSFRRDR